MNEVVAVVDDEADIRSLLEDALRRDGFRVRSFADGSSFLASVARERPDAVVLDLMLPDLDGFEICRRLRRSERTADIAVVILTARAEEANRVAGLELGADDYVVKPFSTRELSARLRAVLRRGAREAPRGTVLTAGDGLVIDRDAFSVSVRGVPVELTSAEFRLLELLASSPGRVYSRERILDHLWGDERSVTERSVDVHIRHLREKLGEAAGLIANVRGVGYKLEP
jgi:DNA-binding response OmpR family regulator